MKYMIVTADDAMELQRLVQKLMDEHGWDPLGGIAVSVSGIFDPEYEYCQALINQGE